MNTRYPPFSAVLLAMTAWLAASPAANAADDLLTRARDTVAEATRPATGWDGPTTGPQAAVGKTIAFVAGDLKNGGILGVSKGAEEAAQAIGWQVRLFDGQGTVSGRTAALNQALALRPAGIVVGGFDTTEQKAAFANAAKAGIPLVGWHAGEKPGPNATAGLFTNITTTPDDTAAAAALWAVADSGGKAGVVIFTDSQYAIALYKARAMETIIRQCGGCTVLSFEDSPIADSATRMPSLTTTLLQRHGERWTHSLAINDLYFDFMGPALQAAGKKGDGQPRAMSAGDGSQAAYQRIRTARYQIGTVPEPLNQHGWQIVDELNRAFHQQPWSGYLPKVHLVTRQNIDSDGGLRNLFDPDNGYRDHYRRIWGKARP